MRPPLTVQQDPSASSLAFNFNKTNNEIVKIEAHMCMKIEHETTTIDLARELQKKKKKNWKSSMQVFD